MYGRMRGASGHGIRYRLPDAKRRGVLDYLPFHALVHVASMFRQRDCSVLIRASRTLRVAWQPLTLQVAFSKFS